MTKRFDFGSMWVARIACTMLSTPNPCKEQAVEVLPIKTKRDYHRTLKEIESLMTAQRNTPQGDRLDALTTLVEAWEAHHYPLDLPGPH